MTQTIPLAEQLKQRIQQENATIQSQTKQQLITMGNELRSIIENELSTIKADMHKQSQSLGWKMLCNRALIPLTIGGCLSLGILGGSWGMMHSLSQQITQMNQTLERLKNQGGKIQINTCDGRLCTQIDQTAPLYQNGYRVLKGY